MLQPMVGAVVVAHGTLAEAMVQVLEHMLGARDGIEAVTTQPTDPQDDIRQRIERAIHHVDHGRGVLILTDMLGDTQTNLSVEIAGRVGAEVLAGVNMPMLVKMIAARESMDARALAAFLRRYGQDHIFWPTEPRERRRSAAP